MKTNKKITFREARGEDAANIVQLISELASKSNERSPLTHEYIAHFLALPMSTILLAGCAAIADWRGVRRYNPCTW
jgi:N-acetylglutamate synthase-like GNAT family acetyltransferase